MQFEFDFCSIGSYDAEGQEVANQLCCLVVQNRNNMEGSIDRLI